MQKQSRMKNNITSSIEYQDALRRIWELMHLPHPAGSPEHTELDLLVSLVEDYEDNVMEIGLQKELVHH
jgi:hypothetical protein